jgi:thymidylate synthase
MAVVQIHGKALKDLYDGKLPKGWKFGEASNKVYVEMLKDPCRGDQPYTYGERLHSFVTAYLDQYDLSVNDYVDQMENSRNSLKKAIEEGIQTNRICGVLWNPCDYMLNDPPCFNHFQARLLEKNKVSLRVLFRSHDFGNACFANWCAIIRVFQDEVIKPAGGILEEFICVSESAHVYSNDEDMVTDLLIGKMPSFIKRWAKA